MKKILLISLGTVFLITLISLTIWFSMTPAGKKTWNEWRYSVETVDDNTNYEVLKTVEDTCRAMIASYTADKLLYEQYKDSDDQLELSWANSAKIRANQTASTYNNYIIKNGYIWKGNIPDDIKNELPYLE